MNVNLCYTDIYRSFFSNRTCIRTLFDLLTHLNPCLVQEQKPFVLLVLAVLLTHVHQLLHNSSSHISQKVVIHEIATSILHNHSTRHVCVILQQSPCNSTVLPQGGSIHPYFKKIENGHTFKII